ncbi:MAG: DUF2125 domain-containing protein [Pseudomonadota bacterium]|nr:DUF2125 domain-containing protein [Pseudomonadota bacterium]
MGRRLASGLLAALALLVVAYTVFWYVAVQRIETGIAAWCAARRAEGWTVAAGAPRAGGWPFAARALLDGVRLDGGAPDLPVEISWEATQVALQVPLLHPRVLEIVSFGAQRLAVRGGTALVYTARRLRARLRLDVTGPPWPVDVTADALSARLAARGAPATIDHMDLHADFTPKASAASASLSVVLAASMIELPRGEPDRAEGATGVRWPLGHEITVLAGDGAISGPAPQLADPAAEARAWRDGGGTVTVRHAHLHWGPLDGEAEAALSLDGALQPAASGAARVRGYARALDVMAAQRVIDDHAALAAKAVLSLVAVTPPAGGEPEVGLPFTLRDRILSVQHIPLIRLPVVVWPGP